MTTQDDRIRRLLVESLDADLGARLDGPGTDALSHPVTSARSTKRWALPVAAAAAVAAVAATVVALTGSGTHHTPAGGGSSDTVVTCTAAGPGDVAQDRSALLARASAISDGTPSVQVEGRSLVISVPGASRHQVSTSCSSTTLDLRPAIAPAVPVTDRPKASEHPLAHLGFSAPSTQAAYDRLTTAQQHVIASRLSVADCDRPSTGSGVPIIVCDRSPLAYLLGVTVVDGASVRSASALAPAHSSSTTTADWSVSLTFDRHGTRAWSAFTRHHHSDPADAQRASIIECSVSTVPCEDFVAFVINGRAISVPLTVAQLGSHTEITGNYTKRAATRLAAALNDGPLTVPLRVVGVRTGH